MPTTYDDYLNLAKPAQGDTTWTTEINENWDTVGLAGCPERHYFVSPTFSTAALFPDGAPNKQRHFNTIQGAIDQGETDAWSDGGFVVHVGAGTYLEKITIGRPCSIVGSPGTAYFDYPAGGVRIRGNGGADNVIEINHWDANVQRVGFYNIAFDNQYSTTNAVEITAAPYLAMVNTKGGPETWGAAQNSVSFFGCAMVCQQFGLNNSWEAAFKADGYWDLRFVECQVMGLTSGGGGDNGYIRRLFDLVGASVSQKCALKSVRSDFHLFTPTTGSPPTQYTYYLAGNVHAMQKYCSVLQTSDDSLFLTGANNYTEGWVFDTPSAADYFNAFGAAMAVR